MREIYRGLFASVALIGLILGGGDLPAKDMSRQPECK